MRISFSVLAFTSVGLLGCASTAASSRRTYQEGDPTGQPRVEALPSLDVDQSALTQEMRMAKLLSAESLNLSPPVRPRDTSTATIADWSDHELKSWMQAKNNSAEAARKELDLAATQNHRQRIMAGAMVGLVYEDMARTLLTLPIPAELSSEPEIAAMYVDILRTQAGPYLMQSRQAYAACSGNAKQMPALQHWSEFCLTREEHLPAAAPITPAESREKQGATETTVSVYGQ
ncbi:MAG: hypothetical protein JWN04_2955 [Myxococcaceae bacterium]|nr:hypothetical protein [Myxococcaceae bacterium]